MKVTLVAVTSLNGKITRNSEPNIYSWTSKEDTKFFISLIKKNNLIVMGSKTYQAISKNIKLTKDKLRIVLTRNSKKYANKVIPGAIEFSNETPLNLVKRLESLGYQKMLLVGGGEINSLFLKALLVDEVYLTIEPIIFGRGTPIVTEGSFETTLKFKSVRKLNSQGTLLLRYQVN